MGRRTGRRTARRDRRGQASAAVAALERAGFSVPEAERLLQALAAAAALQACDGCEDGEGCACWWQELEGDSACRDQELRGAPAEVVAPPGRAAQGPEPVWWTA